MAQYYWVDLASQELYKINIIQFFPLNHHFEVVLVAEALAGPEQRLLVGLFVRLVDRCQFLFPGLHIEKYFYDLYVVCHIYMTHNPEAYAVISRNGKHHRITAIVIWCIEEMAIFVMVVCIPFLFVSHDDSLLNVLKWVRLVLIKIYINVFFMNVIWHLRPALFHLCSCVCMFAVVGKRWQ